jgi:hypothetical protein
MPETPGGSIIVRKFKVRLTVDMREELGKVIVSLDRTLVVPASSPGAAMFGALEEIAKSFDSRERPNSYSIEITARAEVAKS